MVTMESRQKYLYLAFGAVILIIYAIVVAIFFFGQNTPSPSPNIAPSPTSPTNQQTRPRVTYDTTAVKKLEALLDQREKLSPSDQAIRKQIIQSAGNKTTVLSQTKTYILRYIQPVDLFQAEINTIDIAQAKKDVDLYFTAKGISKNGLCYLPLTFYLSKQTSQQLTGKNISFSPIPDGC